MPVFQEFFDQGPGNVRLAIHLQRIETNVSQDFFALVRAKFDVELKNLAVAMKQRNQRGMQVRRYDCISAMKKRQVHRVLIVKARFWLAT